MAKTHSTKKTGLESMAASLLGFGVSQLQMGEPYVAGVAFLGGVALYAVKEHYGTKELPYKPSEEQLKDLSKLVGEELEKAVKRLEAQQSGEEKASYTEKAKNGETASGGEPHSE